MMQPHQERVIAERDELDSKLRKLDSFLRGEVVVTLPVEEQNRLTKQAVLMKGYLDILSERIAAFSVKVTSKT